MQFSDATQAQVIHLDIERLAKKVREVYGRLIDAEGAILTAQQAAAARRHELGKLLLEARARWPARGPNAKGWGDFLRDVAIDEDLALVAMKYAEYVDKHISHSSPVNLPTLAEAGLDNRRRQVDGASGPDRDSWCTPKALAQALGRWDLDPCSNDRSHVKATATYSLERGQNGLELAAGVKAGARVFINPPYSDVMPWIEAYAHTRFCFLLKVDASTKWFAALHEHTKLICVPRGTRIEFEAPPDVDASSNQFPHGLFFARESDATEAIRKLSYVWRIVR